MEPEQRLDAAGVRNTILFFGSARSRSPEEHAAAVAAANATLQDADAPPEAAAAARAQLARLAKTAWMCPIYDSIVELSRRLTEWSMGRLVLDPATGAVKMPYIVATGGGPGLMEAANRGAASVPGAMTIGMGISLPFEAGLNRYCTPETSFEMHYFFTRKFSMCAPTRAFVACPGGYGTADELFEVLTLLQSGKIEQQALMPVVLFGVAFWKTVVNWQALADYGTISQFDVDRLLFTDSVDEAFEHITHKLLLWEAEKAKATAAAAAALAKTALSAAAQAHAAALQAAAAVQGIKAPPASPGVVSGSAFSSPAATSAATESAAEAAAAAAKAAAAAVAAAAVVGSAGEAESYPAPTHDMSTVSASALSAASLQALVSAHHSGVTFVGLPSPAVSVASDPSSSTTTTATTTSSTLLAPAVAAETAAHIVNKAKGPALVRELSAE